MILHCMKKSAWEAVQNESSFGEASLETEGFIHCSSVDYFWRVAPNFKEIQEAMVLLCIDESLLNVPVRYEDADGCGRSYPHIYGRIPRAAVQNVLPFLRDADGNFLKNPELASIPNR